MTAIVSGAGLGLTNTSASILGLQKGDPATGRSGEGATVNVATGNLIVQRQDEILASRGLDLGVLRTYNSQATVDGDNNDNWRIGFYRQLKNLAGDVNTAGSKVVRVGADGAEASYNWDGATGKFVNAQGAGSYDTLAYSTANSQWTWVDGDSRVTEVYDWSSSQGTGKLLSQTDTNGNATTYAYTGNLLTSALDASGERTYLDYTGNNLGQVRTVKADNTTLATRVRYSYDTSNRLSTVTVDLSPEDNSIADGKIYVTTYTYDGTSKRIATLTQTDGSNLAFVYDASARVVRISDALGHATNYSYDTVNSVTTVTDALGFQTKYAFNPLNGQLVKVTSPAVDGVSSTRVFSYNANGDVTSILDANGNTSSLTFDANGNQLTSTDAQGTKVTRTYNAYNQLLTETGATGGVTRHVYDAAGKSQLRFTVDAMGGVTEYRYNAFGQCTTSMHYAATLYTGTGSQQADLDSWVAAGATRSQATRTDMTYDFRGQLATSTVYDSLDASGNGLNGAATTTYVYDQAGNLLKTIAPAGGVTQYLYDGLGRLLTTVNALNNTITNTYGDSTRINATTDFNGNVTRNVHDLDDRLIYTVDGIGAVTKYDYDAIGNVVQTTSYANVVAASASASSVLANASSDQVTRNVYDANNRLAYSVDGMGVVTGHSYDGSGNVTRTTVFSKALPSTTAMTKAAIDAVVNTTIKVSYVAGTDSSAYRSLGNFNSGDRVTVSVRFKTSSDTAGRIFLWGNPSSSYAFSDLKYGNGDWQTLTVSLTIQTSGDVRAFVYGDRNENTGDKTGHFVLYDDIQVSTLDHGLVFTDNFSTSTGWKIYGSNAAASLVRNGEVRTNFNDLDQISRYTYDANQQLRMIEDPMGVRQWMFYDAAGNRTGDMDGNGSLMEYVYDKNNQVVQTIRYASAVETFVQDFSTGQNLALNMASVRPMASASDQKNWNIYDTAGRLAKTVDADGSVTETRYDGASRIVQVIAYANTIGTASLGSTPGTAQIMPTPDSVNDRVTRHFYDNGGALAGVLDGEGYLTESRHNAAGQGWQTIQYATLTDATLRVNGTLDQLRPAGSASDIKTFTQYDGEGQVVGKIDGEGHLSETSYDSNGNVTQTRRYANKVTASISASSTLDSLRPAVNADDQMATTTYDALNRVRTSTSVEGTTTRYDYDSVGNLIGTTVALDTAEARTIGNAYDLQGRLISATDGRGKVTGYQYDAANRLISATDANGNTTRYYYNEDNQLAYTINALGEVSGNSYNALNQITTSTAYATRLASTTLTTLSGGRVTSALTTAIAAIANTTLDSTIRYSNNLDGALASSIDAMGNATLYRYNAFGEQSSITMPVDANSTVSQTYLYDRRGLRMTTTTDGAGINASIGARYDAFGRVVQTTDANDRTRMASYDRRGRQVQTTDALNKTHTTTYDAFDRTLVETDALGNATTTRYDTANRSITVTTPENISVTTVYNRHGQTQSVTDGNGNTITYSYDANGNLIQTSLPLGRIGTQVFDNGNRLIETTDVNSVKTRLSYDAANRLLTRVVDPSTTETTGLDLTTSHAYDAKGRKIRSTDANGNVTEYSFDKNGQLTQQAQDPGGLNIRTQYTYDAQGRQLTVVEGAGTSTARTTQYTYDKLGQRINEQIDPAGLNITTQYGYDKNGNVVSRSDANNNVTRYAYDEENRQIFKIDPLGATTKYEYDSSGNLTKTTAYANALAPNAMPASVTADSTRDQVTRNVYDAANRLVYTVDAISAVTRYEYDSNGNLTRTTAYANALAPNAMPASVTADSARDQMTRNVYDAANRLVYTVDAISAVTRYEYDSNGNLAKKIAYANALASDSMPASVTADSARDQVTQNVYDAANRLIYTVDAIGAGTRFEYDATGNVTRATAYAMPVVVADDVQFVRQLSSLADLDTYGLRYSGSLTVGQSGNYDFAASADDWVRVYIGETLTSAEVLSPTQTASGTLTVWLDAGKTYQFVQTFVEIGGKESLSSGVTGGPPGTASNNSFGVLFSPLKVEIFDFGNGSSLTAAAALALTATENGSAIKIDETIALMGGTRDGLAELLRSGRIDLSDPARDRVTQYAYDKAGRQTRTTYPTTAIFSGATDIARLNSSTAGAAQRVETSVDLYSQTYRDAAGQTVAVRDAAGNIRYQIYDQAGRMRYAVDTEGYVTEYVRDPLGNVTELTRYATRLNDDARSDWLTTPPSTSAFSQWLNAADANNRTVKTTYDAAGRALEITEPTVFAFDGNIGEQKSPITRNSYDLFGRNVQTSVLMRDGSWASTYQYYDQRDQEIARVDAAGYIAIQRFDAFGNVTDRTEYAMPGTTFNSSNYTAPPLNENDRTLRFTYDLNNRTLSDTRVGVEVADTEALAGITYMASTNAINASTRVNLTNSYQYDLFGNLIRTTDAADNTIAVYYDQANRTRASTQAAHAIEGNANFAGLTEFIRDVFGNVTRQTERANGATGITLLTYSTSDSGDDRVSSIVYDTWGRSIETMDAAGNRQAMSYDASGNLGRAWRTVADANGKGVTSSSVMQYNSLGQLTRTTEADGTFIPFGTRMNADQSIYSSNGQYRLLMQSDGNLVIYEVANSRAIWRTGTHGNIGAYFCAQGDGNLVIYNAGGTAIWTSGTSNNNAAQGYLSLQDDGNLVIYSTTTGEPLWYALDVNLNSRVIHTQYQYNAFGEMTAKGIVGFDDGWSEYFDYDAGGRLWRTNSGDGVNKVMLYDLQGNLTSEIRSDTLNLKTGIANAPAAAALAGTRRLNSIFNLQGKASQAALANGAVVNMTYDRWGNLLSASDPRNQAWKTEYEYNANNQMIREIKPVANLMKNDLSGYADARPETRYYFDYAARQVAFRDARGNVNRTSYDNAGNVTRDWNADGSVIQHGYNAFGNETRRTDAMNNITRYEYDRLGQMTRIIRPTASFYRIGNLDAWSNEQAPVVLYKNSDYEGQATYFGLGEYRDLSELGFNSIKVRSGWKVELFDDDAVGTDDNRTYTGNVIDVPYDLQDDIFKLKVTRTDGGGAAAVVEGDGTDSDVVMTYDAFGRQLARTNGAGKTSYGYDLRGNVVSLRQPGELDMTNRYDVLGRKIRETNESGETTTWTYDYFGRLTARKDLGGATYSYEYDSAGQLTLETNTRGRHVKTTYDTAGQIKQIDDKLSAISTRTTKYTYDSGGRHTNETTIIDGTNYSDQKLEYNALGQLTYAGKPEADIYFSYDLMGNRMRSGHYFGGWTTLYYAYDSMNRQILSDGAVDNNAQNSSNLTSGHRLAYDSNGNRISDTYNTSVTETYVYDALNRLVTVWNGVASSGTKRRDVKYDRADRVIQSFDNTTGNLIDAQNYTNVYDGKGYLVRQYFSSDDGLDRSAVFNSYDAIGNLTQSVRQTFDQGGFISKETYSYDKYDSYKQRVITGIRKSHNGENWTDARTSTLDYDVNGYLQSITDSHKTENNRLYINDTAGRILQKTQQDNVLRNAMANGQVLGTFGKGIDTAKPANVSKVTVSITFHVISQSDSGDSSEFDLRFTLNGGNLLRTGELGGIYGELNRGEEGINKIVRSYTGVSWPPANNVLTVALTAASQEVDPTSNTDLTPITLDINTSDWIYEGQSFYSYIAKTTDGSGSKTYYDAVKGQTIAYNQSTTAVYRLIVKITSEDSAPSYNDTVQNFSQFQKLDSAHPGTGPGSYRVNSGDTLQGIAQGAYGDGALWYLIADANGLSAGSSLQAGQILTMPATVGTVHNNADTFKPYEASRMIGDTSPTLAVPAGASNCAAHGFLVLSILTAIIVTVAVSIVTVGMGTGLMAALFVGAIGGALGSAASQGVMLLSRQQQNFSWADVGIGAATGVLSAGAGKLAGGIASALGTAGAQAGIAVTKSASYLARIGSLANGTSRAARVMQLAGKAASESAQQVVTDAFGQGLRIAAGMQDQFDWKSTVYAAVGGAGGALGSKFGTAGAVLGGIAGSALGNVAANAGGFDSSQFISDLTSVAGGALAQRATMRANKYGGRVLAVSDQSPETAKSVREYLGKHPDARVVDMNDPANASQVRKNDKLVVMGHNQGSEVMTAFLQNLKNAPKKVSVLACNAASDVDGANLVRAAAQVLSEKHLRSEVSGHTGQVQMNDGVRMVDDAASRKLRITADGIAHWSASTHVGTDVTSGWLTKPGEGVDNTNSKKRKRPADDLPSSLNYVVYDDFRTAVKHTKGTDFTADHIISNGAVLRRYAEIFSDIGLLNRNKGSGRIIAFDGSATMTVPIADHIDYSRTYGGRNKPARIAWDAAHPGAATWMDVHAYRPVLEQGLTPSRAFSRIADLVDRLMEINIRSGVLFGEENPFPNRLITRRHST